MASTGVSPNVSWIESDSEVKTSAAAQARRSAAGSRPSTVRQRTDGHSALASASKSPRAASVSNQPAWISVTFASLAQASRPRNIGTGWGLAEGRQPTDEQEHDLGGREPQGGSRRGALALGDGEVVRMDAERNHRQVREREALGAEALGEIVRLRLEDHPDRGPHGGRGADQRIPRLDRRREHVRDLAHGALVRRGVGDAAQAVGRGDGVLQPAPRIRRDPRIGPIEQSGAAQLRHIVDPDPFGPGVRAAELAQHGREISRGRLFPRIAPGLRRPRARIGAQEPGAGRLAAHQQAGVDRIGFGFEIDADLGQRVTRPCR